MTQMLEELKNLYDVDLLETFVRFETPCLLEKVL